MDKKCRELTEQYFNDPESKYPHGEKQLLFSYTNPNGSNIGRQQICYLVAFLLGVKNTTLDVGSARGKRHGVIPYSVFAHIENAHCWAHAQANLRMPLQPPGSDSCIGENYF